MTELRLPVLDLLLAGLEIAFANLDVRLRALQRFASRQAGRRQFRLAFQRLARDVELGAGALQADAGLLERGVRAGHRGDIAPNGGFRVHRIDLQEKLSGADAVAFLDGELRDAAHGLGADVHRLFRVDLARRRDDRFEIALLDGFDGDRYAGVTAARERGCRAATDHNQRHDDPEPLLAKH